MLENIIAIITRETGKQDIKLDTLLSDLGIDSLDFLDLMLQVEKEFWPIPQDRWVSLQTVGDVLLELEQAKQ